jgi:peptidoglycan/LPS O-acetylase OafA/YrhL
MGIASIAPLRNGQDRIAAVEALRGIAALAVAWFHVTNANASFPATDWLRVSGAWGWLGVESFFVISGFVLPLAMHRAGYRLKDAGRFLTRRLIRLHPAYLASLAVVLALWWISSLSPGFDRQPPSTPQVLLHVVYLPALFGYDWLNAVYWTLGIEVQFYVLLAVSYPLLAHRASVSQLIWLAAATALSFVVTPEFLVFRYLVVFAFGAVVFLIVVGLVHRVVGIALLAMLSLSTLIVHGLPVATVAVGTAALIALHARLSWPPLLSIGALSYSLYLIHAPIGGRIVNFGSRYAEGAVAEFVVMLLAMLVSLAAAFLLYWLVERPSLRLAARLTRTCEVRLKPDTTYATLARRSSAGRARTAPRSSTP